jgi:serine/threonine protein kinase
MEIKIKKKIGNGTASTIYAVDFNKIPCILKISSYDDDISTKSGFSREIQFAKFAKDYPDYFMQLVHYGVIEKCKYKCDIPKWATGEFKKLLVAGNKLTKCCILVYFPILSYTWENKPRLSTKQYYTAIKQLVESVNIMKINGYEHRDIHLENIMYNAKLKRWVLIDYGAIWHKSFDQSRIDVILSTSPNDMIQLIRTICNNAIFWYAQQKGIRLPSTKVQVERIKADIRYNDIKKYIPNTNNNDEKSLCIILICIVKYYDLYMECIGINISKYKKYIDKQVNDDLLLYMIKHSCDKNYKSILSYIDRIV